MGVNFYRQIVFYKGYFEEFYNQQPPKVQRKINEVLYLVANFKIIPSKFLGFMVGTEGVYEIRIEYGGNIFRIFCFFVSGNKIVLVNGFQKKTNRTPINVLKKAEKIKQEYYNSL